MNMQGRLWRGMTPLQPDYPALGLFGRLLLIVLGQWLIVPSPWTSTIWNRFLAERVALPDGRPLCFTGRAGDIWAGVRRARRDRLAAAGAALFPHALVARPDRPAAHLGAGLRPSLVLTPRIAQLALGHRVPSMCSFRGFAEAGGLMSYWYAEADIYRRVAAMLDKVLKGASPAKIPVEEPTKPELCINLRTARALGLTVPPVVLAAADDTIE